MDNLAQSHDHTVVPNADNTQKFITTRRYPIYYLAITKCASTYLKNVFFALDNDRVHQDPDRIHDYPSDLVRADRTPRWMIRRSPYAFAVIRDPVSRFLSLYFDKIYGDGPQNFPDLRQHLAGTIGLDLSRGVDADRHRHNCKKLIEWIARNLERETSVPVNPHWRRQISRIRAVEHMKPAFLTAENLDAGLLHHLGRIVPDLEQKMAMVRGRNRARYPFAKQDVLDPGLEARINAIYADDAALYRHVQDRRNEMDLSAPVRPKTGSGISVLTTHRFGINAVVQPKAGSTYIRNLFYRLDHGVAHPTPVTIDSDKCLVYRRKPPERLAEEISFAIVRDPVERFFSLYFDKVWADKDTAFPWVAEALSKRRRFHTAGDLSEAEHHDNCCRLLGYLETRFKSAPVEELNPHWRPQSVKLSGLSGKGFSALTLDKCTDQLRSLVAGRVRDFDLHLDALQFRNATEKPIPLETLCSPWIMERLQGLYGDDIALYRRVQKAWTRADGIPEL